MIIHYLPYSAARSNAVSSRQFLMLGSAPCSRSTRTDARWPNCAALCRAVSLSEFWKCIVSLDFFSNLDSYIDVSFVGPPSHRFLDLNQIFSESQIVSVANSQKYLFQFTTGVWFFTNRLSNVFNQMKQQNLSVNLTQITSQKTYSVSDSTEGLIRTIKASSLSKLHFLGTLCLQAFTLCKATIDSYLQYWTLHYHLQLYSK